MFAVKSGEVKEITKYREPKGASNGVMWCSFCDYSSMDGKNITRCGGCGAEFREVTHVEVGTLENPETFVADITFVEVADPEPEVSGAMCNVCGVTFKSIAGVLTHQRRKHTEG